MEDGDSIVEPYVGLEFDSSEEARLFYTSYANQSGFETRTGQPYRSRVDGSITSRRYVCSKQGIQANYRTGCPAYIKVKLDDSGKWLLEKMCLVHNHVLGTRVIDSEPRGEPYVGLGFTSVNEAYGFYSRYATNMGFKVRMDRSKRRSFFSRIYVCSKQGHKAPLSVGCGAFMKIQRQNKNSWLVCTLSKEHNHELDSPENSSSEISKNSAEEISNRLEDLNLLETNSGHSLGARDRENRIGSQWYNVLLDYFQTCQAKDAGFFYSIEVDNGRCMSIFWADGRSRLDCTKFGDAVIFDTSYEESSYTVPFASFVGVNHHRQPVLLGCALISDKSEQSFSWVFRSFLAMTVDPPRSIIADQDRPIRNSIAQVFPQTRHQFSSWQILAKEHENLEALRSMKEFKLEYETCISQSQTAGEFESSWGIIIAKYKLEENTWLEEMFEMRRSWVPLYLKETFFAGIPVDGMMKSYFSTFLTPQVQLNEFLMLYEKAIEHNREEERKEDFNSVNIQTELHTKDPLEEQCRRLYTITVFKLIQIELLESYSYVTKYQNSEGAVSRYLVHRCGKGDECNTVAFNDSNLEISCSCRLFDFEGILCRHALKVFQIRDIREIPPRYILDRWTKGAKYEIKKILDFQGRSLKELRNGCEFIKQKTSINKFPHMSSNLINLD